MAKKVFARAIEKIGAERISRLNIQQGEEPIVSNDRTLIAKRPSQVEEIKNGWFVKTHSSTAQKISILNKIAKKLGIKLKCEVVEH